ncbi:hypothetical protein ADIS_2154 [Lunatimonas lonarensis]|uniref:CARDB domain-containing protein n=1 Tax=Lunatimonas lonarensis TaxID=1232681 RepID=R7ZT08_9BACT|nr:hypothetical protein [Lunatimonas lonarensis]EON77286.1 hypothetical protein ADIS_2154 [Lunatimonas lonarensis]
MNFSTLTWIVFAGIQSVTSFSIQPEGIYDLEATEVIVNTTETGERYFAYVITNVGSEPAPAGSYEVFLSVNGKVISLDTKTSALDPGKSILYTSETKFSPDRKKKKLKYKLTIHTKDGNKSNNQHKGVVEWE